MSGQFFESYVFAEIAKSWLNSGKEPPLFYYRDKEKREIDLLLLHDGHLFPIEIKKTASPSLEDVKNFTALDMAKNPSRGDGCLICMTEKLLTLDEHNLAVHVWAI